MQLLLFMMVNIFVLVCSYVTKLFCMQRVCIGKGGWCIRVVDGEYVSTTGVQMNVL